MDTNLGKIFLYDDDPRRFDADYFYNKGSFAQITDGLNAELQKRGLLGDEKTATNIGFASGLKLEFGFRDKHRHLVHVWETSVLPDLFLEWRAHTTTTVFGLSKQIADLWDSYGFCTDIVDIGVDPDFWHPLPEIPKFEKFTFLSVTSCNFRSGIPELLTAFNQAFAGCRDVRLIIKNTDERARKLPDIIQTMRGKGLDIIYDCRRVDAIELRNLMAQSHALVYAPIQTSGGIPITEAGALGLPVLTCDYCPTNIYPTCAKIQCQDKPISEIKKFVVEDCGLPYTFPEGMIDETQALMHIPDITDFATQLDSIKRNYDQIQQQAIEVRKEILRKWTWSHSCDQLLEGLGYI